MNLVCWRIISAVFIFTAICAPGSPSMAQASSTAASSATMPDWQIRAGGRLAFEVAIVKSATVDTEPSVNFTLGPGDVYARTNGRFLSRGITLLDYIRFAYKLTDGQAEIMRAKAPDWIDKERFDIQAKSELPDPSKDQMRLMMQSLLVDRFGLAVHQETRELPVLALVLAKPGKLGTQLHPHSTGDSACSNVRDPADQNSEMGTAAEIPAVCGGLVSVGVPNAPTRVRIGGRKVPLELLAAHLGQMGHFDRPIVDQTGLSGTFDFVLEWEADSAPDSTAFPVQEDGQSTLLEALKDQLGLKLVRTKALSIILLIDHINRQPIMN